MVKRQLGLDIFRGVAVVLVIFRHIDLKFIPYPMTLTNLLSVTTLQRGGWVGVDIFFVLSGFLVSGLFYQEYLQFGNVKTFRFLARRGFKIYPSFYLMLLLAPLLWFDLSEGGALIVVEALYFQSYFPSLFPHTWSLAVEEHFYIVFPLIILILIQVRRINPFKALPYIYLIMFSACLYWRITAAPGTIDLNLNYSRTHVRIDSLMCGATLSYFYYFYQEKFVVFAHKYRFILLSVGILLLLPAFLIDIAQFEYITTVGLAQFQIGSAMVLASILVIKIPINSVSKTISLLGFHSYSIYLWHPIVHRLLTREVGLTGWVFSWTYFLVSIAVGLLMGHFFETPILKVRNNLLPSRSKLNREKEARNQGRFSPAS